MRWFCVRQLPQPQPQPPTLPSPTIPAKITNLIATQSVTADRKPPLKKWPLNSNQTQNAPVKVAHKWKEYQGVHNWEGLLDPLDDNLRNEILRYGHFVEAAYNSFDFDPSSPSYATSLFPKASLLERSGLPSTGYRISKNLRATSGIRLPRWVQNNAPSSWVATQSSWIGYVAVCQDKDEISRLGRRDVVIAFRGTGTSLEWLENLRATLTKLPDDMISCSQSPPMVESGFWSLYSSGSPSLRQMVHEEISRLLQSYGDHSLSLTITGHSLGAALAILAAYDIKQSFKRAPLVTVISFGGPRVGNRSFRQRLEKQGTKILRIVNSDDVITKVPGFVLKEEDGSELQYLRGRGRGIGKGIGKGIGIGIGIGRGRSSSGKVALPRWIQKCVEETKWVYSEVGRELRLSSRDSPHLDLSGINNVATCHELKTYLHLVDGFVSSTCPFRATARRMLR